MIKIDFLRVKTEEEKLFLKKLIYNSEKAFYQHRPMYTDFYDVHWMREVIRRYIGDSTQLQPNFYGGYEEAERKVLGFVDEYMTDEMCPVKILKVIVHTGIGKNLTHRDFLGAILNMGIERSKIGDIVIKPFGAYIIVHEDVKDFILWNMTKISRYGKIEIEEIEQDEIVIDPLLTKEILGTVSSLRADAVAALGFGLSRGNCTKLLKGEKGKCNGMLLTPSENVKQGDVITLRGYGKIRLKAINGRTKKDRLHLVIEKYI